MPETPEKGDSTQMPTPKRPLSLRSLQYSLVALGLASLLMLTGARAPKRIGKSCVTSKCHQNLDLKKLNKKTLSLHRPVKFKHCNFCHKQTRPREHTFKIKAGPQLCRTCHRKHSRIHTNRKKIPKWRCLDCHKPHQSHLKKLLSKKPDLLCRSCHRAMHKSKATVSRASGSFHKPVHKGQCLSCHRPHLPTPKPQLMRRPINQTCVSCHKKTTRLSAHKGWTHTHPKLKQQCIRCHQPHNSRHKKLLRRQGSQMCLQCHKSIKHDDKKARSRHKDVGKDCLKCHTPHGAKHRPLLQTSANNLCLNCHKDVYTNPKGIGSSHHIAGQPRACLSCHQPHNSTFPKLQRKQEKELCMSCHQKPLKTRSGRTLAALKTSSKYKTHKPIQKGECLSCHKPHQSKFKNLFKLPQTTAFYAQYNKQQYTLCYSCHKPKLASKKTASKNETNFRNGTLNLHFVHVNKARRGRNCSTCHAPHESLQHGLIRPQVPYAGGVWSLPITFKKHPQGGGCVSGCHKAKTYNRDKPVHTGYILYPQTKKQSK